MAERIARARRGAGRRGRAGRLVVDRPHHAGGPREAAQAGFAPPTPRAVGAPTARAAPERAFRCPYCGSTETRLTTSSARRRAARSATARAAASRSSSSRRSEAAGADRRPERRPALGQVEHRRGDAGELRARLDQPRRRRRSPRPPAASTPASASAPGEPDLARRCPASSPRSTRRSRPTAASASTSSSTSATTTPTPSPDPAGLRRRLAGLPVLFVGVHCPIEVILAPPRRRRGTLRDLGAGRAGAADGAGLAAVHDPGLYDLELDTSRLTPSECAAAVAERLHGSPPTAFARLAR